MQNPDELSEMGARRPTVTTISRRAGVAASTVSRALKGDPRIAKKTRAEILEIAKEVGYMPYASARAMVTGQSGLIGFVTGGTDNPFYSEMLEVLVSRAGRRRRRVMVLHAGTEPLEESTVETLVQYQMDGCIITSAELSSRAADICHRFRVPVVMMNRVPLIHSSAVSCNNYGGSELLIELLLAAGHKKIAIVGGTQNTSTSLDRQRGAADALARRGLEPVVQVDGQSNYMGGLKATALIIAESHRPDAIYAVNDIMAMGVVDALGAHGIRVPDDVSVIGFDDIRSASWPRYSLTTVAQPIDAMVDRSLDLLEARIAENETPAEAIHIAGKLRLRRSCRLPDDLVSFQQFV